MKNIGLGKLKLIFILGFIVMGYRYFNLEHFLSLENLKENQNSIGQYYNENPLTLSLLFVLAYIVTTALSIPGATVLTLAGGAIFGFWIGTLLVSFGSSIGATFAFLASRYLLREAVQNKFGERIQTINDGMLKDGAFYLFTLRLIPVVPFFLVNLVMGLTSIKTRTFYMISADGDDTQSDYDVQIAHLEFETDE